MREINLTKGKSVVAKNDKTYRVTEGVHYRLTAQPFRIVEEVKPVAPPPDTDAWLGGIALLCAVALGVWWFW